MSDGSPATSPNAAMSDNWNGIGGAHWVRNAARHDRALAAYGQAVLDAAAIGATDRVLDIGCGTGALTRGAARQAVEGTALGVDIGHPMVTAARAQAAADGPKNVAFEQADAQVMPFEAGSFDVVLSRFGVMFFDDPAAAFANVRRGTTDRARLVFVCWRSLADNDWMAVPGAAMTAHVGFPDLGAPDAPGPFSLAEPQRVRAVLGSGGFDAVTIDEVAHPMWLGTDVEDAVGYMRNQSTARVLFEDKPAELVDRAIDAVRAALEDHVGPDGITLAGSAWLVTARAA